MGSDGEVLRTLSLSGPPWGESKADDVIEISADSAGRFVEQFRNNNGSERMYGAVTKLATRIQFVADQERYVGKGGEIAFGD